MNKTDKLSKKAKKHYRKLLEAKCQALQIEDKHVYQGTGKKKAYFKKDERGDVILENGKPKVFMIEPQIAKNPQRSLIKKLLNSSEEAVKTFLGLPTESA